MTMRITMTQTRMGESGSLLTSGSTYTVSDAFGAAMVGAGYATDTDAALTPPESQPLRLSADGTAVVSGDRTELVAVPSKLSQYVIAHRGGSAVAEENCLDAFKYAYAAGARHIEMDVRVTSNGTVVVMHDATTTRTTNTADTIASTTTAAFQAAVLDLMNSTGGNGYNRTANPPLLAQVLEWAADKPVTLWIEAKVDCAAAIVMELQNYRILGSRAVIQAFTQSWLTPAIDAGYGAMKLHTGSMASVDFPAIAALGVEYVGGDTWTLGQVTSCKAAGCTPVAYTVYYLTQAEDFNVLGIDYLMWVDPEMSRGRLRSKTTFAGGKFPAGIVGGDSVSSAQLTERGTMFASGGWGWASSTATYFEAAWQNWYGDLPASYTMTIVASIDAVADAAKWLNILICSPDDGAWTNPGGTLEQSGYQFLVRQNGTIDLYLLAAGGTSSIIGTASGTAFTLGTSYTMTVTVTPTTVSITANGTTVSATNSAYRGSRFAIGRGNADIKVTSIAIA